MTFTRLAAVLTGVTLLAGCEGNGFDKTVDQGIDAKPLSQLKAGIWIDPEGCDHWIINDGAEGYLTARRAPDGKPVCSGKPPGGYATGPYKSGSEFAGIL
jgi:hypothetical protein